jgi:hypothetical protein
MPERESQGNARATRDAAHDHMLQAETIQHRRQVIGEQIKAERTPAVGSAAATLIRRDDPKSPGERRDDRPRGAMIRHPSVQHHERRTIAVLGDVKARARNINPGFAHPEVRTAPAYGLPTGRPAAAQALKPPSRCATLV